MQIISLAWGILALLGFIVAFIPCLGALNWLNIPFAVCGLILSIIAYATGPRHNRTGSLIGIILCLIAVLIGAKRLVLGGFVF